MPARSFALVPASYVYLLRGEEVLLQHRWNTGYMDGYWVAGAAGHIEPGETARRAAAREVREEAGVVVPEGSLELVTVMQRTDGSANPREQRVDWFWTSRTWEGSPRVCEPRKADRLEWFALDALPDPIPEYERYVLEGLRDGTLPLDSAFGFEE
ncbi:NUDIX domain-containing protein [Micrococcus luteus]|uniref:NUDIX domain-containing protein n=1 Tax=Micrococcus luteus TaxID=1270 RepID=UPI0011AB440A|nr:NUDIX domain-containing protein [Micrococcus luteus]